MNDKIEALVFSKNRPMQLTAYLESLIYATNIGHEDITVITPWFSHGYEKVKKEFSKVKFLFEFDHQGFHNTLTHFLQKCNKKYILFGCDDVIYKDSVDMSKIVDTLEKNNNIFGFSLRLGNNIKPFLWTNKLEQEIIGWPWINAGSHWGYPFELMATVYRTEDIIKICSIIKNIKTPNYMESEGVRCCYGCNGYINGIHIHSLVGTAMCCFNSNSKAVAQDVNRVQNDFPNKFTGTEDQDPEHLKRLYQEGKRLNWKKLWKTSDEDCFVGNKYWEIV